MGDRAPLPAPEVSEGEPTKRTPIVDALGPAERVHLCCIGPVSSSLSLWVHTAHSPADIAMSASLRRQLRAVSARLKAAQGRQDVAKGQRPPEMGEGRVGALR